LCFAEPSSMFSRSLGGSQCSTVRFQFVSVMGLVFGTNTSTVLPLAVLYETEPPVAFNKMLPLSSTVDPRTLSETFSRCVVGLWSKGCCDNAITVDWLPASVMGIVVETLDCL